MRLGRVRDKELGSFSVFSGGVAIEKQGNEPAVMNCPAILRAQNRLDFLVADAEPRLGIVLTPGTHGAHADKEEENSHQVRVE